MKEFSVQKIPSAQWASSRTDNRLWRLDVTPRKIYVRASLSAQTAAMRFALQLMDAGFIVTSSWLRKDFSDRPDTFGDWKKFVMYEQNWGETDLKDLDESDTLIILAEEPSSSGGFHAELGYFLGAKKTNIIVVGNRPNVFFWTPNVRFALTTSGLPEWLKHPDHGKTEVQQEQFLLPQEFDDSNC